MTARPSFHPWPKPAPVEKPRRLSSLARPTLEQVQRYQAKQSAKRKPIKAKPRTATEDLRIYGPVPFRTFLHAQSCMWCGAVLPPCFIQQAHLHTGGTGRKDDWQRSGPLCANRLVVLGGRTARVVGCHQRYDEAKATSRAIVAQGHARFFAAWRAFSGAAND